MENDADPDTVREVYERAIANVPPIQEKRHWKRYIYLWINYALYEELEVKVSSLNLHHHHHHHHQPSLQRCITIIIIVNEKEN